MQFISKGISQKLLFVVYTQIGCLIMVSIGRILEITYPNYFAKLKVGFETCSIILQLILLILIVIIPIWIYRVHKDMCIMFATYPISPKKSIMLTFIPFYNVWGLWKICKTLFDMFRHHGLSLKLGPFNLHSLYILFGIFAAVDDQMFKFFQSSGHGTMSFENRLTYAITYAIVSISTTALGYTIVKLISSGVASLHAKMKPESQT